MNLTITTILTLIGVSFTASIIDTIAGGGGLLTLPVLLSIGIPPANALATNKLQSIFGTASSSVNFIRRGYVNIQQISSIIIATFFGAVAGAVVVQVIDAAALAKFVPVLLIAVAIYIAFSPVISDEDAHRRVGRNVFLFIAMIIGFYDGFFGPGTGSFFVISFVTLLGFNIRKATANTKILNLSSNVASVIIFSLGGKMLWVTGLLMGVGQIFGGYVGSHLVIKNGAKLVRPALILVSVAITLRVIIVNWS